jgi:hypothetical protein
MTMRLADPTRSFLNRGILALRRRGAKERMSDVRGQRTEDRGRMDGETEGCSTSEDGSRKSANRKKQKSLSLVHQGEFDSFSQDARCLTDGGDGHVIGIFIEEAVQG